MSELSKMTISLLGKEYQIGVTDERRDSLAQASRYLDSRLEEARENLGSGSIENIAVITALNLASEIIQQNEAIDTHNERLDAINKELGSL